HAAIFHDLNAGRNGHRAPLRQLSVCAKVQLAAFSVCQRKQLKSRRFRYARTDATLLTFARRPRIRSMRDTSPLAMETHHARARSTNYGSRPYRPAKR